MHETNVKFSQDTYCLFSKPDNCHPVGLAGALTKRSFPTPEVRGGGREELPLAGGQGPHLRGATLPPRSGCCAGTGGPRGATLRSRSERAAVRRFPSSKVRCSGCTLLEQP